MHHCNCIHFDWYQARRKHLTVHIHVHHTKPTKPTKPHYPIIVEMPKREFIVCGFFPPYYIRYVVTNGIATRGLYCNLNFNCKSRRLDITANTCSMVLHHGMNKSFLNDLRLFSSNDMMDCYRELLCQSFQQQPRNFADVPGCTKYLWLLAPSSQLCKIAQNILLKKVQRWNLK